MSHWWCCCGPEGWPPAGCSVFGSCLGSIAVDLTLSLTDGTCPCEGLSGTIEDIPYFYDESTGSQCYIDFRVTLSGSLYSVQFYADRVEQTIALQGGVLGTPDGGCGVTTNQWKYPASFNILDATTWASSPGPWPCSGSQALTAYFSNGCILGDASVSWAIT